VYRLECSHVKYTEITPSAYSAYSAVFVPNNLPFHFTKWFLLLIYYFNSTGIISPNAKKKSTFFSPTDTTLKYVPHPSARVIKGSYDLLIYWIVILVTNVHFLVVLSTVKINTPTDGLLQVSALWWEIM
jgi:hypothetical protein